MNHIRDKLPDMKARLNTLMGQAQQELNSFGDSAVYGDKNQVCCYLHLMFIENLTRYIPNLARGAYSPPYDPIRSRLRLVHRRYQR